MWFDKEESKTLNLFALDKRKKRQKTKKRVKRKKLNTRVKKSSAAQSHRTAVFVMVPVVLIAACALTYFLLWLAGGMLFSRNDKFKIKHLEIPVAEDAAISKTLIEEYTGITNGMNLFAVDIDEIRSDFLAHTPNAKEIEISRNLPDTLIIEVTEREPVARIGRLGRLVADSEGFVFPLRKGRRELPLISGYKGMKLSPGVQIKGMALAALQVMSICRNPILELEIERIDIKRDAYMLLHLSGPIARTDRLPWKNSGEQTHLSKRQLQEKLTQLSQALRNQQSKGKTRFDSTYAGRVYAQ